MQLFGPWRRVKIGNAVTGGIPGKTRATVKVCQGRSKPVLQARRRERHQGGGRPEALSDGVAQRLSSGSQRVSGQPWAEKSTQLSEFRRTGASPNWSGRIGRPPIGSNKPRRSAVASRALSIARAGQPG